MEPAILFEDDALVVIDKPPGMIVYPDGKHDYPALSHWLEKKYKDALNWRGPLAGATIFRIDGFLFKVHSHDHGKHLHIIHKGRGIDARFSFPELQVVNYKSKNILSSKEEKLIQEFIRKETNFKKLEKEFERRDTVGQ